MYYAGCEGRDLFKNVTQARTRRDLGETMEHIWRASSWAENRARGVLLQSRSANIL